MISDPIVIFSEDLRVAIFNTMPDYFFHVKALQKVYF